ncbi:hypothetical protein [Actinoplanes sp. GCM10030250]|uniref:hypothetical protein n=1 Tax=Actinoplanes sp. GCM10030250 TaxID=3273376 RepID=UPI003619A02B
MHRYLAAFIGSVVLATSGVSAVEPAQAAERFTFSASAGPAGKAGPVKKGGYVTLSGRAPGDEDLGAVVFSFRADGSSKWVYQNATRIGSDGRYARRQAQNHSGTWRAEFFACDDCDAVTRTDHVAVSGVQLPGIVNGCIGGYYVEFNPRELDISCTSWWAYQNFKWTSRNMRTGTATAVLHVARDKRTYKRHLKFDRVVVHHGALTYTRFTEVETGTVWGMNPAEFIR